MQHFAEGEQPLYGRLGLSQEQPNLGNMFAVHLVAFYFSKLKEDQIKKVRTLKLRCLAQSTLTDPTAKGIKALGGGSSKVLAQLL